MKERYYILFLLLFIVTLSGCSKQKQEFTEPNNVIVEYPDAQTYESVNGYSAKKSDSTSSNEEDGDIVYYANLNSKKFHLPSCRYGLMIDETDVRLERNRDFLINDGFSPCKSCKP